MAAIFVAIRKRQKPSQYSQHTSSGDQDDAKSDSSENNAGAAIDAESEDYNSLLGLMPGPSTALLHGSLHKVDFRGEWALRQGLTIDLLIVMN
jgi:hypothetical protein